MMWTVVFSKQADKAMASLHPTIRKRVSDAIDDLLIDPFKARNIKRLKGSDRLRIRVGGYRVVYELVNERLIVIVIDVGPRGGIYD